MSKRLRPRRRNAHRRKPFRDFSHPARSRAASSGWRGRLSLAPARKTSDASRKKKVRKHRTKRIRYESRSKKKKKNTRCDRCRIRRRVRTFCAAARGELGTHGTALPLPRFRFPRTFDSSTNAYRGRGSVTTLSVFFRFTIYCVLVIGTRTGTHYTTTRIRRPKASRKRSPGSTSPVPVRYVLGARGSSGFSGRPPGVITRAHLIYGGTTNL